jgi:hypothetical protein
MLASRVWHCAVVCALTDVSEENRVTIFTVGDTDLPRFRRDTVLRTDVTNNVSVGNSVTIFTVENTDLHMFRRNTVPPFLG